MWPNPQETADLVTFTEEILNGKLHFRTVGLDQGRVLYTEALRTIQLVCTQNFPKTNIFTDPLLWYANAHMRVFGGKKCSFFRKFCVCTKWIFPYFKKKSVHGFSLKRCACFRIFLRCLTFTEQLIFWTVLDDCF